MRGGAEPVNGTRARPELVDLTAFSAFCALYLGITENDGFGQQSAGGVARRFDVSEEELFEVLDKQGIGDQAITEADFDLESAQLDIQVAPAGISRTELARTLYAELLEALGTEAD